MENVCVRFEKSFIHDMEEVMKGHRYATKTEFIREAVRDKIKDLETKEALIRLEKVYGASKRKTTKEQMRKAKEEAFEVLSKKFS
tara:strand:+ start:1627 stop:1881 length:255 start_codon:yes stop_codon:yes gene_type:complete